MFPKLDPKKMQALMQQMGIRQEEIPAEKVIIQTTEKNIIISNPSVQKVNMQGQVSWQISGEILEEPNAPKITDDDIALVAEKTSKSKEKAKKALEDAGGDIAEAITLLSE